MYRTQAAGRRRRMPSPRSPVGVYQQPLQDENPVGKSGKSRERILLRQRLSRKWYQFRIPGATTKIGLHDFKKFVVQCNSVAPTVVSLVFPGFINAL
jgi:hypothetical protein